MKKLYEYRTAEDSALETCSLYNKLTRHNKFIVDDKPHVVCLCETWLAG